MKSPDISRGFHILQSERAYQSKSSGVRLWFAPVRSVCVVMPALVQARPIVGGFAYMKEAKPSTATIPRTAQRAPVFSKPSVFFIVSPAKKEPQTMGRQDRRIVGAPDT